MEEDVLLDMYRNTWDAFLEAYKEKMDQVDGLSDLCTEVIQNLEDSEDCKCTEQREKLKQILEV